MLAETLNTYYNKLTNTYLFLTHCPNKFYIEKDYEVIKTFSYSGNQYSLNGMYKVANKAYEWFMNKVEEIKGSN